MGIINQLISWGPHIVGAKYHATWTVRAPKWCKYNEDERFELQNVAKCRWNGSFQLQHVANSKGNGQERRLKKRKTHPDPFIHNTHHVDIGVQTWTTLTLVFCVLPTCIFSETLPCFENQPTVVWLELHSNGRLITDECVSLFGDVSKDEVIIRVYPNLSHGKRKESN